MREALERGIQSGVGSAAVQQRERNEALERRVEVLEGKLRSGLEDARSAMKDEVQAMREEQAKTIQQMKRRLTRVAAQRGAQGVAKPQPNRRSRRAAPWDGGCIPT